MQKSEIIMKHIIKLGTYLLAEFHRLDDYVLNQKYLEVGSNEDTKDKFKDMLKDLEVFNSEAAQFINDTNDTTDSKVLFLKNRQHEYVNDFEIDSPMLRDFYSYSITIEQVMERLKKLSFGHAEKRKHDSRFHYAQEERIIYRNETEMPIHSKGLKRETLVELAFKQAQLEDRWVTAEEIEDRRTEKTGYDDNLENPYDWIRKACDKLNSKTKEKFGINFDLFEKDSTRIRLNPKA